MGYVDSQSHNGAKWRLEYTEGTSKLGVTPVHYKLITTGREGKSSDTAYTTFCHMKIYDSNNNLLAKEDFVSLSEIKSFTGQVRFENDFNVQHDANGKGKFIVVLNVEFQNGVINNPGGKNTREEVTLSQTSYSRSKCSAPTSISTQDIVTSNGEVTVSWSGAKKGISNEIKGYQVYWKISSNGSNPSTAEENSKSVDINKNWAEGTGSTVINIGQATAGYQVVFGIVTKGEAGPSYYSTIACGGKVKINTPPPAPSEVTSSKDIVSTSGEQVTFTIFSEMDVDGQPLSYKYAVNDPSSEKIPCNNPLTLENVKGGTYYFWTCDGLEDSVNYYEVAIGSNTKPTISINVTGTSLEANNIPTGIKYIINPTITLTKGEGGRPSNNTYSYYIYYRSKNEQSWTKKTLGTGDPSLVRTIDDIRALGYFTNLTTTDYYYYFSAIRDDGMDVSDEEISDQFFVSKPPSLIETYNKENYENVEIEDFQKSFSQILSFKFGKNAGYNSLKIYNNLTLLATIPLNISADGLYGQWIVKDLTKGSYNLKAELGHTANSFYTAKIDLGNFYKIAGFEIKNLKASSDFQVYNKDTSYDFSIQNVFNVSYQGLSQKYKEYGISDVSKSFYAKLSIGSEDGEKCNLTIAERTSNGSSTTPDTLFFNLTAAQLYNMLPSNISDKNKTYQGTLTIGIENVFEAKSESSIKYNINYGIMPEIEGCAIKVDGKKEIDSWAFLKEGMPLTVTGKVISYNTNPKIQIQVNRIKKGVESGYIDLGRPISLIPDLSNPNKITQNNPFTYTFEDQQIIEIGELIELNYQADFRVKIITDADEQYHYTEILYKEIDVCGHSQYGAIALNRIDYVSTDTTRSSSYLEYQYTNTHPGAPVLVNNNYSLEIQAVLQYRNIADYNWNEEEIIIGDFLENSNKSQQVNFTFPADVDAIVCRLALRTTQTVTNGEEESYKTVKRVYSNEQAAYNILPTVSYRKNLLGINASNLNSYNNAVVVIGEHSSKNIIYLVSSTGIKQINTSTGELDGFIVDCGEW